MERLTFSLDEDTEEGLGRVRDEAQALAAGIRAAVEDLGPGPEWEILDDLPVSLERLGEDPSSAAVVREALRFYLRSIEELVDAARMAKGYAELAKDSERDRIAEWTTGRVAKQWADEP